MAAKSKIPKAPKPEQLAGAALLKLVKFDEKGLVPVAVVDRESGELLMLAWANKRALELTLNTGYTHFWSRSRNSLWKKGETTGHVQRIESLELDCDGDTLVARVDQNGVACHTGAPTCFFRRSELPLGKPAGKGGRSPKNGPPSGPANSRVLFELLRTIRSRRGADPESSYTAKLLSQSAEKRAKKLIEESSELLLATVDLEKASKKAGKGRLTNKSTKVASGQSSSTTTLHNIATYEAADVLYHYLVALEGSGIALNDVWRELGRRFGMSGIEEKKNRKSS